MVYVKIQHWTQAGQSITLVYVDGTRGWKNVQDSTSNVSGTTFISATGGTETTSGNFKIHTFNSDANFVVSSASNTASFNDVSFVVAGGGGGAGDNGAGGGAGGFRENKGSEDSYTASPLNGATPAGNSISSNISYYCWWRVQKELPQLTTVVMDQIQFLAQ